LLPFIQGHAQLFILYVQWLIDSTTDCGGPAGALSRASRAARLAIDLTIDLATDVAMNNRSPVRGQATGRLYDGCQQGDE